VVGVAPSFIVNLRELGFESHVMGTPVKKNVQLCNVKIASHMVSEI
jgi:hypothetical protein